MAIRKAALLGLVVSLASIIGPLRNLADRLRAGMQPSTWWLPLLALLALAYSLLMPAFYLALFLESEPIYFSRGLRKLALAAATIFAVVVLLRLRGMGALHWGSGIGLAADACYVLLLLVMSQDAGEAPPSANRPSDLLTRVAKLAALVFAMAALFQLIRMIVIPLSYSSMERFAYQVGRSGPSQTAMLAEAGLTFLSQASVLAAPFIVWRSLAARNQALVFGGTKSGGSAAPSPKK